MLLSDLDVNKKAIITKINGNENFVKRLNNLGVCIGANVCILRYAPLKDPIEISVNGFVLAIRKKSAKQVEVKI